MNEYFKRLLELKKNAYVPFSHYSVACILDTDKGEFLGVNVEPDVLNLGVCGERNAIFNALTCGMRKINHIYLLTDSKENFGTPCGACRQLLTQFSDETTEITFFNLKGEEKDLKLFDLLPSMWSRKDLD